MRKKVTLLQRAQTDLKHARLALDQFKDELDLDLAAYHAQQCLEKCVKYIGQLRGIEYSWQHKLRVLFHESPMPDIEAIASSVLPFVDDWENGTRYGSYTLAAKTEIEKALAVCDRLIEIAILSEPGQQAIRDIRDGVE